MANTTGTYSDVVGAFYFPSGTIVGYLKEIGYPSAEMKERNITNHANGAVEERVPAGQTAWGDFTLVFYQTPGLLSSIRTDLKNGQERVCYLTDEVGGLIFTGWYKSVEKSSADAASPDSALLTVIVTPHGDITPTGGA